MTGSFVDYLASHTGHTLSVEHRQEGKTVTQTRDVRDVNRGWLMTTQGDIHIPYINNVICLTCFPFEEVPEENS